MHLAAAAPAGRRGAPIAGDARMQVDAMGGAPLPLTHSSGLRPGAGARLGEFWGVVEGDLSRMCIMGGPGPRHSIAGFVPEKTRSTLGYGHSSFRVFGSDSRCCRGPEAMRGMAPECQTSAPWPDSVLKHRVSSKPEPWAHPFGPELPWAAPMVDIIWRATRHTTHSWGGPEV